MRLSRPPGPRRFPGSVPRALVRRLGLLPHSNGILTIRPVGLDLGPAAGDDNPHIGARLATVPPKTARIVVGFFLAFTALRLRTRGRGSISPLQSLLAVALLGCGLLASWILYDTLLSPIGSFSVVWEGALYLTGLSLVNYTPIRPVALLVCMGVSSQRSRPLSLLDLRSLVPAPLAMSAQSRSLWSHLVRRA